MPGLDALVNGGYFLGSTTVVAGISGVGKSVMGLQFLAEGARRGERSLMLTLDEQVPQVIRNANSIGIDLQELIDSGIVRVQYDTPQEIEIDRHFHDLEQLVEEFKPTRVLFDSLSTYGSNLGTTGRMFRDFFHALVALMKEHQTATVYNHENPEMLGMASMMGDFAMSSLVDNILLMNWIELGDAFRLGLTVAKMRANPNARATHECEILNGQGMRVLPRQIPAPMVRPFSSYLNLISRNPDAVPGSRRARRRRMGEPTETLFDVAVWGPALEKFGAVTQLSVALYGADEQIVCGPMPATPIVAAFQEHGYDPGVFAECVRQCLAQSGDNRPPVVVTPSSGLARRRRLARCSTGASSARSWPATRWSVSVNPWRSRGSRARPVCPSRNSGRWRGSSSRSRRGGSSCTASSCRCSVTRCCARMTSGGSPKRRRSS